MTLAQWADNGWLKKYQTSKKEIGSLLLIADRDLKDATQEGISLDWRFGIAYNAALKLCTILLYAEGYRPAPGLQHYRTIASLPLILGEHKKNDADYLEDCRRKRNKVEYDCVGGVTETEVNELVDFVKELRIKVVNWLRKYRSELMA